MDEEKRSGVVKFFNPERAFGFIIDDDGGKEYFVHITNITNDGIKTLYEGDKVSFYRQESDRGPVAIKVTKV